MYLVIGCGNAGASIASEFMASCSVSQRSLLRPVFINSLDWTDTEASVYISSYLEDFLNFRYASGEIFPGDGRCYILPSVEKDRVECPGEGRGKKFEDGWIFFRNNRGKIFEDIIRHARLEDISGVKLALIFYSLAGVTGGGGGPPLGEIFQENNIPTIGVAVMPSELEGNLASSNASKSLYKSLECLSSLILADNELIAGENHTKSFEAGSLAYKKFNSFVSRGVRDLVLNSLTSDKILSLAGVRNLDFTDLISSLNLKGAGGIEKGVGVIGRATVPLKFWGGIEETRPYMWIELIEKQLSVNLRTELEARRIQRAVGTVILHESLVQKFPFKDFEQALAGLTSLNYISLGYSRSSKMGLSITLLFSLYSGNVSRISRMERNAAARI